MKFKIELAAMFLFLIGMVAVVGLVMFEPREKVDCSQFVVLDKFVDSNDQRYIVFENAQRVESEDVTIEKFYSHEIGDEVQACLIEGKYTKFHPRWRIEE